MTKQQQHTYMCNNTYISMYGDGLVTKSCPTLVTPWTVACEASLSMGFFRQEYWSGLPFPSLSHSLALSISLSLSLWEIDGETVETVSDFIFLGSKITTDGDCSHEIKRRLLLGRKVMTNLDSIFKSRDITLPTKFCLDKAMVFPVVMYGCESWTVKKAER